MKKILLSFAMIMCAFTMNAQDGAFTAAVNVGLTSTGNDFMGGVDLNYAFSESDDFTFGATAGFYNVFGSIANANFMPLALTGRYPLSDDFVLGADVGYGIGFSNAVSDFYYRPMVGYNISDGMQITASYQGYGSSGSIVAGLVFGL